MKHVSCGFPEDSPSSWPETCSTTLKHQRELQFAYLSLDVGTDSQSARVSSSERFANSELEAVSAVSASSFGPSSAVRCEETSCDAASLEASRCGPLRTRAFGKSSAKSSPSDLRQPARAGFISTENEDFFWGKRRG